MRKFSFFIMRLTKPSKDFFCLGLKLNVCFRALVDNPLMSQTTGCWGTHTAWNLYSGQAQCVCAACARKSVCVWVVHVHGDSWPLPGHLVPVTTRCAFANTLSVRPAQLCPPIRYLFRPLVRAVAEHQRGPCRCLMQGVCRARVPAWRQEALEEDWRPSSRHTRGGCFGRHPGVRRWCEQIRHRLALVCLSGDLGASTAPNPPLNPIGWTLVLTQQWVKRWAHTHMHIFTMDVSGWWFWR